MWDWEVTEYYFYLKNFLLDPPDISQDKQHNCIFFLNMFAPKVLFICKGFSKSLNCQYFRNSTMEEGNTLERSIQEQIAS